MMQNTNEDDGTITSTSTSTSTSTTSKSAKMDSVSKIPTAANGNQTLDPDSLKSKAKELGVWKDYHEEMSPGMLKQVLLDAIQHAAKRQKLELMLANKDVELAKKDVELAKKDAELANKDVELEMKDAEQQETQKATIQHTYTRTDGKDIKFKELPLKINEAISPSIGGNMRKVLVGHENGIAQKMNSKIEEASIRRPASGLWYPVNKITIPVKYRHGAWIPSQMGAKVQSNEGVPSLTYVNEFGVQNLVVRLVEDAIKCLGLQNEVDAHTEVAINTLKPDMVVVLRQGGRMIFALEVKCPGKDDAVFKSQNAAGQIYSYLRAMQQLGNKRPIGAVTTLDKLVLVTLEDCGDEEDHKRLLRESMESLSTGLVTCRTKEIQDDDATCATRKTSPIRVQKHVTDVVDAVRPRQADADADADDFEEKTIPPEVYYSAVYNAQDVFPSLLQGLDVAYRYCTSYAFNTDLPITRHRADLARRMFFRVSKEGYSWVLSPKKYKRGSKACDFQANAEEFPDPQSEVFYFLGKAGQGGNGAVYLACNTSARLCAIKVYHIKPSAAALEAERIVEEDATCERRYEEAKAEAEAWREIYKERSIGVRSLYLGGRPCLLMPYGVEIEDASQRAAHLGAVKAELSRFAKEHHRRYKNDDIRWKHVLLDSKNKVFLADLGSLEDAGTNLTDADVELIVDGQIKVLQRVAGFQAAEPV